MTGSPCSIRDGYADFSYRRSWEHVDESWRFCFFLSLFFFSATSASAGKKVEPQNWRPYSPYRPSRKFANRFFTTNYHEVSSSNQTWGICTQRARKLYKARSRLYRSQILQVNARWKALAEIYTMHSFAPFAPFSNLKNVLLNSNC